MTDLKGILSRFEQLRLLVIGDFMVDEFVTGEISRVSREAPVLILKHQETRHCPGGAANTAVNVASLGAEVITLGMVGEDDSGRRLRELWPSSVNSDFLFAEPSVLTTRKIRILAGSFQSYKQQVVRIDYENPLKMTADQESKALKALKGAVSRVNGMIISDYSLGFLTPGIRQESIRLARKRGIPVVVDSRDNSGSYPGATTVTPNISEVEASVGTPIGTDRELLERICTGLVDQWKIDSLLVTRGRLGLSLFQPSSVLHIPPHGSEEALDVTGAGDTVAAVYTAALAAGASLASAARVANIAGGLVVMKKGTASVSRGELEASLGGE